VIRFRRQFAGCYWGQSDRHSIRILKSGGQPSECSLEVSVRELAETAGIKHVLNQPMRMRGVDRGRKPG
jgi:hypothetical protein